MISTNARRRIAAALAGVIAALVVLTSTPAAAADRISDGQWYVKSLDLASAHRITQGDGVKVGVIDAGIDPSHPDISGSVVAGADFSRQGPSDGLADFDGHGTSMASLIVGHGQIRGVAPHATIVSLRVSDGFSDSATAVGEALRWAISHDIRIVSISSGYTEDDLVLRQAVQAAVANDIVIVAAIGNKPQAVRVPYPAAYAGVLAVGGTTPAGTLSPISVTGTQIQLTAPSDGISTAYRDKRRVVTTGTSNSTALVAGAVALIRAKYPNLPAAEVIRRLTSTAIDKGPAGRDDQFGYGIVNVTAALLATEVSMTSSTAGTASTKASVPASTGLPRWLVLATVVVVLLVGAFLVARLTRRTS